MNKVMLYQCLCMACVLLVLSGCWDRVEIEERGFVIGAAIDSYKPESGEDNETEDEAPSKAEDEQSYTLTYQLVVPGALQNNSSGGGKAGGAGGEAYMNIPSVGNSMFQATREMATRTSRAPYLEHLKLILVSEELAKGGSFAKVLDFFVTDYETRRTTHVFVVEGEARKALNIKPTSEKLPAIYINSVTENTEKSARILSPINVGKLHRFLLEKMSYTLPRIVLGRNDIKLAGAAVFEGTHHRMVGYLGEEETEGLNFITGELKGGILEFELKNALFITEIIRTKSKIHADVSDQRNLEFWIKIHTDINIGEVSKSIDQLNEKMFSDVEKQAAKEVEAIVKDTIEKVQKGFKLDVLGLGSHLKEEHYDTWKAVKDNWDHGDNFFAKSKIHVQAEVTLRNIGLSNKTQE